MYFIESIHGVIVDVVNNLQKAQQAVAERSGFRTIPRRAFQIINSTKVYVA